MLNKFSTVTNEGLCGLGVVQIGHVPPIVVLATKQCDVLIVMKQTKTNIIRFGIPHLHNLYSCVNSGEDVYSRSTSSEDWIMLHLKIGRFRISVSTCTINL